MNIEKRIDKIMQKYGRTIGYGNSSLGQWHALVQPLRYKNKMYLQGTPTEIGRTEDGYYLYIGPADRSLFGDNVRLECEDMRFSVDKTERVYIADKVAYIWAVLRQEIM
jgi:hypothetical protein